ncbi:MAG TPA: DUF4214 domain-containing protein, partial [Burkholderiaceae bacterium]
MQKRTARLGSLVENHARKTMTSFDTRGVFSSATTQEDLQVKQGCRRALRHVMSVSLCALALSACGDGGNESGNVDVPAKAKALVLQKNAGDYQTAVQELYVSYFGRPADPTGLTNFEMGLFSAGAPTDIQGLTAAYSTSAAVKTLIDSFGTSAESIALYGTGDNIAFVSAVFQNVLGRAPAATGLAFWSGALDNGTLTRGDAALSIMAG